MTVRSRGLGPLEFVLGIGREKVPSGVPSLRHSCLVEPSVAWNRATPLTGTMKAGLEAPAPALMSLTRTVPAAVPSLFHSSAPLEPSSAEKKTVSPTAVRLSGLE